MSVTPWGMSLSFSPAGFIAYSAFLGLLVAFITYCVMVTVVKPQKGRPKKRQRSGNKGGARGFVRLEPLQFSETHCPIHLAMDAVHEVIDEFNRTHEELTRFLEKLSWEMTEGSDSSSTPIMASNVGSSSHMSLSTLVDGADMTHASSIQPGLAHPRADLEEQPGLATHPPCEQEASSSLEAGSVQQYQQDLTIQLGAPTPPPELPDVRSREMEMPLHHNKGQETLEGPIESKLEQGLGLPVNVEETLQNVPASAPPKPPRPEKRHVMVVPIVQDLPFLDEAVKRELEQHISKMKIQNRYGLQTRLLECEQSFEKLFLR